MAVTCAGVGELKLGNTMAASLTPRLSWGGSPPIKFQTEALPTICYGWDDRVEWE